MSANSPRCNARLKAGIRCQLDDGHPNGHHHERVRRKTLECTTWDATEADLEAALLQLGELTGKRVAK